MEEGIDSIRERKRALEPRGHKCEWIPATGIKGVLRLELRRCLHSHTDIKQGGRDRPKGGRDRPSRGYLRETALVAHDSCNVCDVSGPPNLVDTTTALVRGLFPQTAPVASRGVLHSIWGTQRLRAMIAFKKIMEEVKQEGVLEEPTFYWTDHTNRVVIGEGAVLPSHVMGLSYLEAGTYRKGYYLLTIDELKRLQLIMKTDCFPRSTWVNAKLSGRAFRQATTFSSFGGASVTNPADVQGPNPLIGSRFITRRQLNY